MYRIVAQLLEKSNNRYELFIPCSERIVYIVYPFFRKVEYNKPYLRMVQKGSEQMTEIVEEKLKLLPDKPGVYLMKDAQGRIIYAGKAVVLKNRVRQYFQSGKKHTPKVRAMVSHIADFEIIMTRSEV